VEITGAGVKRRSWEDHKGPYITVATENRPSGFCGIYMIFIPKPEVNQVTERRSLKDLS
jgi:hypothetical protein